MEAAGYPLARDMTFIDVEYGDHQRDYQGPDEQPNEAKRQHAAEDADEDSGRVKLEATLGEKRTHDVVHRANDEQAVERKASSAQPAVLDADPEGHG